jgi:hypothetical protein
MTTKPLTLMDAAALLRDLPTEEVIQRDDLQLFIDRVETAGKTILEQRGEEYVEEASVLLLSAVMAELISTPTPEKIQILAAIQKYPSTFELIVAYAFIYSVGLGVVEELY